MDREACAAVHGGRKQPDRTERLNLNLTRRKKPGSASAIPFTYFEGYYAIMYRNFSKPSPWQHLPPDSIPTNQNAWHSFVLAPLPQPRSLLTHEASLPVPGRLWEAGRLHRARIGWELRTARQATASLLRAGHPASAAAGAVLRLSGPAATPRCRTAGPAAMSSFLRCERSPTYDGEACSWSRLMPFPTAPLTGL